LKIAALDIGSNSIHMIIAEARVADRSFQVIDREKDMVKLGGGCFEANRLTDAAAAAGLRSLRKCAKLIERHGCEEIIATATSAVREAANGGEFLHEVARETGIHVRVVSGEEEARLIYLAVRSAVDLAARRALILDVGGGSVEAIVGDARGLLFAQVMKLGVLRLRDRFGKSDPLSRRDRKKLEEHCREVAAPVIERARGLGFDIVAGTSGTIQALAGAARNLGGRPLPEQVTNETLSLKELDSLVDRIAAASKSERAEMPGFDQQRADSIHMGGILLGELMRLSGAREIVLCGRALREGLVIDFLERTSARVGDAGVAPDIRRRSLHELVKRCETSGRLYPHGRHVSRLALSIFDQLGALHGLGPVERQLLEFASLVHDVGEQISFERHERHTHYLVRNADLRGFTREEVELVALIARYHRGGAPKRRHPEFGRLNKRTRRAVRRLAAILRLADGLDRSHFQIVRGVGVSARDGDGRVRIVVETSEDAELEVFTARRKGRLFERVFKRKLEIRGGRPPPPAPPEED
jgi:exopolyphosphatase/guanosine-5'-triphosphate,3'-diphosphate pyrophosphatase